MSEKAFTPAELNQGFVVAIEIVAKAGEEDIVAGALEALIKPTMAEPGVKLFLPYRSPTDPSGFLHIRAVPERSWMGRAPEDCPLQVIRRQHAAAHRET